MRTARLLATLPTLSRTDCGSRTPRESKLNASFCARSWCCGEGSGVHPSLPDALPDVPASWCDNRRSMSCCCSVAKPAEAVLAARASLASDSMSTAVGCILLCDDSQILSLTVSTLTSSWFDLRMLADYERKSTAASGAPLQADRLEGQRRLPILKTRMLKVQSKVQGNMLTQLGICCSLCSCTRSAC